MCAEVLDELYPFPLFLLPKLDVTVDGRRDDEVRARSRPDSIVSQSRHHLRIADVVTQHVQPA